MVGTLFEIIRAVTGREIVERNDVHAAEQVNNLFNAREIDTDLIIHIDPVKVLQRGDRILDAVVSGMRQLVAILGRLARDIEI